MTDRIARMRRKLEQAFAPSALEIRDDSHRHAGHAGARGGMGHYRVRIRSQRFRGTNPLERHRLVYEALGDMMQTDIHALQIEASDDEGGQA
ncbi:MAG TPA: BolA family protein [Gammaproteobacteria bacterium]|nr:BolA family protein [Gammaproteobacteria bacterium]